jgi:hypothetical protein
VVPPTDYRNKRSVWTINNMPDREAHFAVMPAGLVVPCIKAGTSYHGACAHCGAPYQRKVEKTRVATRPGRKSKYNDRADAAVHCDPHRHVTKVESAGWEKTCGCRTSAVVPCMVLDPFAGSGTVLAESIRLGRRALGIELNPSYAKIAERKIRKASAKRGLNLERG